MELVCYSIIMKIHDLSQEYLIKLRSKIESRYVISKSGCWEWTRGRFQYGYGKIKVKGHTLGAHRVYYQLINGAVPSDLVISHLCDNPPCINPAHLEATTQWENNARGSGVSAVNLYKTHCVNGHEFTQENTILGDRRRACRKCANAHTHRRDLERTKEYNARGLNSKGKPFKRPRSWRLDRI